MIKSICIIGQGNVGTHLCVAFAGKIEELYSIDSRTLEDLPIDADLYIISVSDDAIREVSSRLPQINGVVAHTSGSTSLDALDGINGKRGVFYPLMTFSKDSAIEYQKIPVFIEGSDTEAVSVLNEAANLFTTKVMQMNSSQRIKMHIASVFACNFVNSLWVAASDILKEENVPFSYFLPLIEATAEKLHYLSPEEAQTGPAKRGDMNIIDKQEQMLFDKPELQKIYRDLSQLIISQTSKKNSN